MRIINWFKNLRRRDDEDVIDYDLMIVALCAYRDNIIRTYDCSHPGVQARLKELDDQLNIFVEKYQETI